MATYYLVNNVRAGTLQRFAGEMVDDTRAPARLWGKDNAGCGVSVAAGGALVLKDGAVPTIQGGASNAVDFQLDGATTARAWDEAGGARLHLDAARRGHRRRRLRWQRAQRRVARADREGGLRCPDPR